MVKPFVIRWNIIGFAGGGAFFLSFLLGVLSSNPFLIILIRALVFGVVFALLGGGAAFVLERFVPQLSGGDGGSVEKESSGKNVDIMLSGESAEDGQDVEELSMEENGGGGEADGEAAAISGTASYAEEPDAAYMGDEGETTLTSGAVGVENDDGEASLLDEQGADDQQVPDRTGPTGKLPRQSEAAAVSAPEKGRGDEDLDVLPDMSHFESSFAPVTSAGMVSDNQTYESFGSDSLKEKGVDEDPATLVKAVRTIIRRDEGKRK